MPSRRYQRHSEAQTKDLVAFRASLINLSLFGWLMFLPLAFVATVLFTTLSTSSPGWLIGTAASVVLFTIIAASVVQSRANALGLDQTWVRGVFSSQLSVAIFVTLCFTVAVGIWCGGWYYDTTSDKVYCSENFRSAFEAEAVSNGAGCTYSPLNDTVPLTTIEYYHCSLLGNCYVAAIGTLPASTDYTQLKYVCKSGSYRYDDRLLPNGSPSDGKSYPFAHFGFSCYSPPAATAWQLIMAGTAFAWTALILYIVWLALISSAIHRVVRANDVLADPYVTQVDYVITTTYPTWYTTTQPAQQPQNLPPYSYPPGMYTANPPPPTYVEKQ